MNCTLLQHLTCVCWRKEREAIKISAHLNVFEDEKIHAAGAFSFTQMHMQTPTHLCAGFEGFHAIVFIFEHF